VCQTGAVSWEGWIRFWLMMPDVQVAQLRKLPIRPVGLAVPPALPLQNVDRDHFVSSLTYALLSYGTGANPLDPAQPRIEIQTCCSEAEDYEPPGLQALVVLAEARDTALARRPLRPPELPHIWADDDSEPPAAEMPKSVERAIVVDGVQQQAITTASGAYEALRFRQKNLVVTAIARHGFPGSPAFETVKDLEPFLAARKKTRRNLAAVLKLPR
jgi:hypothetical protein